MTYGGLLMLENITIPRTVFIEGGVSCRRLQVCIRCTAAFLASDEGEGVSAEEYSGDTLYTVLDGVCRVGDIKLTAGKRTVFPAGELHSVTCTEQFRIMQTTAGKVETTMKLIDHVPHKEAISLKNQSAREIQNAPVLVKQ